MGVLTSDEENGPEGWSKEAEPVNSGGSLVGERSVKGRWCGPERELRPRCSFKFIRGKGYDGVRTVPGVASNGARTVRAESVEIVAEMLGNDSLDPDPGRSPDAPEAGLPKVGVAVVLSDGLVPGELFVIFCSCFFASASLILRRMISRPCGS